MCVRRSQPLRMPITLQPISVARYTTDLMTEFRPGTSPPPVRTPMVFPVAITSSFYLPRCASERRESMVAAADGGLCQPPRAYSIFSAIDRKSTRLNSSHGYISYAVFCLKKKNKQQY